MEGVATVGEPLWTGGVGCRGVLGTDLPLSPCDRWHRRAVETLWGAGRDRRGPGQRSYPCAVRGTRVYPTALACVAIVVIVRSRSCASEASRPCWTYALPCCNRRETRRASVCAVAVMALGVPRRACIRRKKAPQALCAWCTLRAARRTRAHPPRQHRAARDVVLGTPPQPAPDVCHAGPPVHVGADRTADDQSRVFFAALDRCQGNTGQARERGAGIEAGFVGLLGAAGFRRQGLPRAFVRKGLQMRFDLLIALGYLLVVEGIQLDGLT